MKTQTWISLLFIIAILFFSGTVNSHAAGNSGATAIVQVAFSRTSADVKAIEFQDIKSIIIAVLYFIFQPHTFEEESHVLHFHFTRFDRNKKYYLAKIVAWKVMLIIFHILLLAEPR